MDDENCVLHNIFFHSKGQTSTLTSVGNGYNFVYLHGHTYLRGKLRATDAPKSFHET